MMKNTRILCCTGIISACFLVLAGTCHGSAFVRGAYYRLGEDDPGAAPGAIGNNPTVDSFADHLDLTRLGSPHYSSDVPVRGPFGDTLSMAFANVGLGGPAFQGSYGRDQSIGMVEQGMALEAWVKAGPWDLDSIQNSLVAYNGDPASNGFGLFLHNSDYVARIGTVERTLGPAVVGEWHHIAYIYSLGTSSYYYDGKLVLETTKDAAPTAATGGFWLGGQGGSGDAIPFYPFNGWIDEVRYQSFNPLAAGAFNPADFLITVPEPSGIVPLIGALGVVALRRRRHA